MKLTEKTKSRIDAINEQIEQYGAMTIRQIYYRLLGTMALNYRQIQTCCKQGREAGLIKNSQIVDRSRPIYGHNTHNGMESYLTEIPDNFYLDYWGASALRPQIWTEKDAISQILLTEANRYNVPVYVTKGFLSISNKQRWGGYNALILYFGDHDPSGLSIDQDLKNDLEYKQFKRIALTEKMIQRNSLPSIPVKKTDPRAKEYIKTHGNKAWEIDALNPSYLRSLIRRSIENSMTFVLEHKIKRQDNIRNEIKEKLKT